MPCIMFIAETEIDVHEKKQKVSEANWRREGKKIYGIKTDLYSMYNNFCDTASYESQSRSVNYVITVDSMCASSWTFVRI